MKTHIRHHLVCLKTLHVYFTGGCRHYVRCGISVSITFISVLISKYRAETVQNVPFFIFGSKIPSFIKIQIRFAIFYLTKPRSFKSMGSLIVLYKECRPVSSVYTEIHFRMKLFHRYQGNKLI